MGPQRFLLEVEVVVGFLKGCFPRKRNLLVKTNLTYRRHIPVFSSRSIRDVVVSSNSNVRKDSFSRHSSYTCNGQGE